MFSKLSDGRGNFAERLQMRLDKAKSKINKEKENLPNVKPCNITGSGYVKSIAHPQKAIGLAKTSDINITENSTATDSLKQHFSAEFERLNAELESTQDIVAQAYELLELKNVRKLDPQVLKEFVKLRGFIKKQTLSFKTKVSRRFRNWVAEGQSILLFFDAMDKEHPIYTCIKPKYVDEVIKSVLEVSHISAKLKIPQNMTQLQTRIKKKLGDYLRRERTKHRILLTKAVNQSFDEYIKSIIATQLIAEYESNGNIKDLLHGYAKLKVKHGILTKDVEVYGTKIKLEGSVTFVQTKLDALEDYFYANSIDTAGIDNIVKECEAIDIDGEPGEPDDSEEAQDSNCPEKK